MSACVQTHTRVSVCGCVHVRSERASGPLNLALQVAVNVQLVCSKLRRVFVASWAPCGESMVELCRQARMSYVHLSSTRKTGRPCSSCQHARAYRHHWSINSNWS